MQQRRRFAHTSPFSVIVITKFELVSAGIASMFEPHRVRTRTSIVNNDLDALSGADVVVIDVMSQPVETVIDVQAIRQSCPAAAIVLYVRRFADRVFIAEPRNVDDVIPHDLSNAELKRRLTVAAAPQPDLGGRAKGVAVVLTGGRPSYLTPRQVEVAALLAAGASTREIAERLFIGLNTAKSHVRGILRALDVNTRTAAAIVIVQLGLATSDGPIDHATNRDAPRTHLQDEPQDSRTIPTNP